MESGSFMVAEVRALNQRFFELKLSLPRGWGEHEAQVRKMVQATVSRGRVEVFMRYSATKAPPVKLQVNEKLARLYIAELRKLGDAQGSSVLRFFQVRKRLRRVALRQQRITQQSMSGKQLRIELQGLLQGRDRSGVVVILKIRLTQAHKSSGSCRLKLGRFTKFCDRQLEMFVLFRLGPGLHVRQSLGRWALRCEE